VQALLDSGAQGSFIDFHLVSQHHLSLTPLAQSIRLQMADGQVSSAGPVTHTTQVSFSISEHHESFAFHVTSLKHHSIILGIDWLHTHNPAINWRQRKISFADPFCNKNCRSSYSVSSLSAYLDLLVASLDHETLEPTIDDYYAYQLLADFCDDYRPILPASSTIPDLACFSLSAAVALHELSKEEPPPSPVLPEVYADFAPLFADKEPGVLPPHRPYDHIIPLEPNAKIPFGPLYNLSQKELEELREYIDDNLKKGFIRRSESPAGAPVLFVPKKDSKKLRLCVDYRALNKITVKNRCPLPLISETLDRLSTARIFTKLDLKGAYNLIRVAEGEEWKTAFRTRYGHFEYLVMPFGLTNAPATFQAYLNDVLRECLDTVVVIYLDDILIYSADPKDHVVHVRRVLQLLSNAQLQVNLEKCQFSVTKVEFLGYIISPEGISMDPAKVKAIISWPTPGSVHDIQVFLGFSNFYRRFIKNFSRIVGPITRLLKKDTPFVWDLAAQSAFKSLRHAFTSEPVLVHFDPAKPCFIEPDASKNALGAVCSQPDAQGVLHPLAFLSRSLTPPERNYHIHDTELLAAIEGLEHWRHYFAYSEHPATILTDHKNLEYFSEKRALSQRQIRYSERLSKFNVVVVYRPGVQNGAADALSRMYTSEEGESADVIHDALFPPPQVSSPLAVSSVKQSPLQPLPILERIKKAYTQDESISPLLEQLSKETSAAPPGDHILEDGLLYFDGRILVPDDISIQRDILSSCHDGLAAGHFGTHKTFELVYRSYHWPGLRQFTKRFVTSCDTCQRNKMVHHKPYGLLQSLPVPQTPWSSISMDFIVQLPESNGFTAVLVVVDRLTKMAHFIPTTDNVDAEGTVALFLKHIFSTHGLPDDIVSDRGVTFTALFTQSMMKALGVKQNLSTAFHPQTNGQTERTNATLEQYLRCFTNYQQDDWSSLLPMAEFSYNNTIHSATKQTPFFALLGYHPRFDVQVPRVASSHPLAHKRLSLLKDVQEDLRFHIALAQEYQQQYYDQHHLPQPNYQPGDRVWLLRRNIKTTRPADKLDVVRLGPFTIAAAVNSRSYRLDLSKDMGRIHPVFHVSLLEPYVANDIPDRLAPPPPPIQYDGQDEFEVEEIVDSRLRYRRLEYKVKWVGYPVPEWEPADNLTHCQALINEFHSQYPTKPRPRT